LNLHSLSLRWIVSFGRWLILGREDSFGLEVGDEDRHFVEISQLLFHLLLFPAFGLEIQLEISFLLLEHSAPHGQSTSLPAFAVDEVFVWLASLLPLLLPAFSFKSLYLLLEGLLLPRQLFTPFHDIHQVLALGLHCNLLLLLLQTH